MQKKSSLYIIIDRDLLIRNKKNILTLTRSLLQAKPDFIQYRFKDASSREILKESLEISKMIKEQKVTKLLINDRVDIALACHAHGVHLGRSDLPSLYARKILGQKAIIGKTVHSLTELKNTLVEPVNYISIGPVFKTRLKPGLKPLGIKRIKNQFVPIFKKAKNKMSLFVIGGITRKNMAGLIKEKISNIAVASDIILSPQPKKVAAYYKLLLSN